MQKYKDLGLPMAVAYTKIDIMPKENIPLDMVKFAERLPGVDIFPISARKGKNVKALKSFLVEQMPVSQKIFEEDIVSDKSERFMIAEIMRQKILLKFDKEIPHGIAIVINTFALQENGVYDINLDIVCERQNHKAILIGKQGKAIKEVSSFARQDMEKFFEKFEAIWKAFWEYLYKVFAYLEEKEAEEKKPLTLEDVRTILGYKSAHGYREEMHSLVKKYGNGFLSSVNPAMYEALLQEAEVYKVDAT